MRTITPAPIAMSRADAIHSLTSAFKPIHSSDDLFSNTEEAARLQRVAVLTRCNPAELSTDAAYVDLAAMLRAMEERGYMVGTPLKPGNQKKPGFTTWHVAITTPESIALTMAFYIPEDVA